MDNDPAISVGSIVSIRSSSAPQIYAYVGIVIHDNTYNPGYRKISIPGIGEVEGPLTNCYNATEVERKNYFIAVLKYGQ